MLSRFNTWHAGDLASSESGISAVEWALTLTFFSFLLVGVVELGFAAQHKMQLSNAVRVGMQYTTVRKPIQGDVDQIRDSVANATPPDETGLRDLDVEMYCKCPDGSDIDCDVACATGDRQTYVRIAIEDQYIPILTLPFTPSSYTLRASGTVRLN